MIEALRITLSGAATYEHVKVYSHFMGSTLPAHEDMFEDSQLIFTCKHGKFAVPDYNVVLIQLHNRRVNARNAYRVKRILLAQDLNYQDCYIIRQGDYGRYGVPQVFREYEQFAFACKDGLFVTNDFQVNCIQLMDK
jgi:hypothetical protein